MIEKLLPAVAALIGICLLTAWIVLDRPDPRLRGRIPGMDQPANAVAAQQINLAGTFVKSTGTPATNLPGVWPGFRGAKLDNISTDPTPLATHWPAQGPKALWSIDLGEGYAGAAVRAGRVYVLDYDQTARRDVLRCLSLADGKEIWNRSYPVLVKRNHGMSRTVPTVTDKYVITLGPKCQVLCLDAQTGDFRWGIDLVREYHTKVPAWYAGQCPLVDDDRTILAPGGDAMMIAVDNATGKVLWKTANPRQWPMSHASILPITFHGSRMYVYPASGGVVGVSADDGHIVWDTDAWKITIATVPTPVLVGDGRLFLTGGYNAGSMMLQLVEEHGRITAKPEFRLPPEVFGSDQQTPIFYQGNIYGVIPGGQLACIDLQGKTVWTSGSAHRFGLGPYMIAQGMIYLVNDTGTLTLVKATPRGYQQLAQARVLTGQDAWGPLALAGNRLIARDLTKMVCLDVGK